ncbi:MAG: addiction module toxin, HicA family [Ardenticatenia bacterium]|nr:MAG: addiction module toxin, HicA family [Ardenticatenia bacterium]
MSYKQVVSRLCRLGLRFYRHGKGSHELWVRDEDGLVIPVPRHKGRLIRKGTIRAIIRELGLSVEEFMRE